MTNKIFKHFKERKIIYIIILALAAFGGYYGYGKLKGANTSASYVLAAVEKGSIVASVSGTGQVAADNQVEIKSKVSGDIIRLEIKNGQAVKANDLLAQINSKDAAKAVSEAKISLATARLDLEKLLDSTDQLTIVQAEGALAGAKATLADLIDSPSQSDITAAENGLISARDSLTKLKTTQAGNYQNLLNTRENALADLSRAYENGFNDVSDAFLDLPTVMSGLNSLLFDYNFENYQNNIDWYANKVEAKDNRILDYKKDVYDSYNRAKAAFDINFTNYRNASRSSESSIIESIILETYNTSKIIAEAVKVTSNYVDFARSIMEEYNLSVSSAVTTHQASLSSYTGTANGHISSLLAVKNAIDSAKETKAGAEEDIKEADQNNPLDLAAALRAVQEKEDNLAEVKKGPEQSAIDAAKRAVKEKELSLAKIKAGADSYDVRAKNIAIQQKYDDLISKQQILSDYIIKSPIDGLVAAVNVKKGDTIGASTILATIISKQKIATISLNEVDVSKIKAGQKATLAFSAIDGLTLTGKVAEIDSIGTITQGVVNYTVKISLDTDDSRIKPEMSVAAVIIIDQKSDVLTVSNSAIKTDNSGASYVEVINGAISQSPGGTGVISASAPEKKYIITGLANDTDTEITQGLNEGDKIVTRTVNGNTLKTTTSATQGNSAFRILGGGGPGR
jgi:multidrug efflux pump subunit AcrA (membrane-fusion protein)